MFKKEIFITLLLLSTTIETGFTAKPELQKKHKKNNNKASSTEVLTTIYEQTRPLPIELKSPIKQRSRSIQYALEEKQVQEEIIKQRLHNQKLIQLKQKLAQLHQEQEAQKRIQKILLPQMSNLQQLQQQQQKQFEQQQLQMHYQQQQQKQLKEQERIKQQKIKEENEKITRELRAIHELALELKRCEEQKEGENAPLLINEEDCTLR